MNQSEIYTIWKTRKAPSNLAGRKNIKIQTNGIILTTLVETFVSQLANFRNISFTFEISLKGTTPHEFEILSGGLPAEVFFDQITALDELMALENQGYPIFARGILGIFHSDQFDLVYPGSNERLMLNPSDEFVEVARRLRAMPRPQERVYVEPLRFTEQMASAEANCRAAGIIAEPEVSKDVRCGRKTSLKKTYLWESIEP